MSDSPGTTVRDIVRVTARGADLPMGEDLPSYALRLHQRALREARQHEARQELLDGIVGLQWKCVMTTLVYEEWPELRRDHEAAKAFRSKLYAYLRARPARNLVCLNQGDGVTQPTWWVRVAWDPTPPQRSVTTKPSRYEAKVTDKEAGADREPAAVTTSYFCTWPDCPSTEAFPTKQLQVQHYFREHKDSVSFMVDALNQLGRAATVNEIHATAVHAGFPASDSTSRLTLDELHRQGQLQRQEVSGPTGWRYAYALPEWENPDWDKAAYVRGKPRETNPAAPAEAAAQPAEELPTAPPPAPAGGIRCREPGCTHPLFVSPDQRKRHEDATHPTSPYRLWPCTVTGCLVLPMYTLTSIAIHIGSGHQIRKGTAQYNLLIEAATAQAERNQRKLRNSKERAQAAPPPAALVSEERYQQGIAELRELTGKEPQVNAVQRHPVQLRAAAARARARASEPSQPPTAGPPASEQDPAALLRAILDENRQLREDVAALRARLSRILQEAQE